ATRPRPRATHSARRRSRWPGGSATRECWRSRCTPGTRRSGPPDTTEERLATATRILELAGADRDLALFGHMWRLSALLELGDIHRADGEIEAFARLVDDLRRPLWRMYAGWRRAMRALLAGRFEDAIG